MCVGVVVYVYKRVVRWHSAFYSHSSGWLDEFSLGIRERKIRIFPLAPFISGLGVICGQHTYTVVTDMNISFVNEKIRPGYTVVYASAVTPVYGQKALLCPIITL